MSSYSCGCRWWQLPVAALVVLGVVVLGAACTNPSSNPADPSTSDFLETTTIACVMRALTREPIRRIFWKEGANSFYSGLADGTGVAPFLTGLPGPKFLRVHAPTKRVYWADTFSFGYVSVNGGSITQKSTGTDQGQGHDFDLANGHIYYADQANGRVRRMDLDFNNVTTIMTGFSTPLGVSIDQVNRRIYVAVAGGGGRVVRANLDGSSAADIITGGAVVGPAALTVDPESGYLFVQDLAMQTHRSNLDGQNLTTLYTGFQGGGMATHSASNRAFFSNATNGKIFRTEATGLNQKDLFENRMSPQSPTLYVPAPGCD